MVRAIFGGTFFEVPPITYVVLFFFSSRKSVALEQNKCCKNITHAREKQTWHHEWMLSGGTFSSTSQKEIAMLRVVVFTIFKQFQWRNYNEKTFYVLGGHRSGPCCCRPGQSRRHQAGLGGPLQGLRHLAQPGYDGWHQ